MISVLIPLLLASPAFAEEAEDDDFSFIEEGEQNRKKFEADRAPAANIFLQDDEDDALPTWDVPGEDSGNIDDDDEFDFDLPSDVEAGMGIEMDPIEDMEGFGPDLSDRRPLGNHFPLVISQSDLGATVAEMPILVARNPTDLNGDLWIVADVYLDGIVGPWFLPVLRPYLEPLAATHYVVLQLSEDEALARVRARQGQGLSPTVTQMHRQLAELGPFEKHRIEVGGRNEAQALEAVARSLASGALELDWSLVVS